MERAHRSAIQSGTRLALAGAARPGDRYRDGAPRPGAVIAPRVLFHSPYAGWSYHSAMEAVLAHALQWRDAEVCFTFCDGLFKECDLFRRGTTPPGVPHRDDTSCLYCQARQTAEFADYQIPWTWLGSWLERADYPAARAFVDGLADDQLLAARWKDAPVGDWAQASAFNQFRLSRVELVDPEVVAVLRECIHGSVLTWMALERVFEEFQPDTLVAFNGRFFSQRVAIEMARRRGVGVICHERGYRKDTAFFRRGDGIHRVDLYERVWADWHDVPLTVAQLQEAAGVFSNRRFGRDLSWRAFSPPPEAESAVRAKLQLDARPVVACFTSSDDEWLVFPERREGAFPQSLDWIPATVEAARQSPELQWVIRMHPNLVGYGVNRQAVDQALRLAEDLPENCRIVQPKDDLSSYTLADLCSAAVSYGTTMGVEIAASGKAVVAVARGWYGRTGFVRPVDAPEDYLRVVREAVAAPPSLRVALAAHRFLFHLYQETALPFPWVEEVENHRGKLTFKNTTELLPGRDATLDALCALVLDGTPLHPPLPPAARGGRSLLEERLLLKRYPALLADPARPPNALHDLLEGGQQHLARQAGPAAEAAALQALQLAPESAEAWALLGRVKRQAGQLQPAWRALSRAVQLDPADGEAWADRLRVGVDRGSRAELTALVAEARAAGWTHPLVDRVASQLGLPPAG